MKAAAVFSDNMVLQRRRPVRIFGTCGEGQGPITVRVPELGISGEAIVSGGRWEAVLPPMEACPVCTLEIISGAVKKQFRNVAVGEVWLAGGQSNMEYELQNELNGSQALAECGSENVRFYYTPKCEMSDDKSSKLRPSPHGSSLTGKLQSLVSSRILLRKAPQPGWESQWESSAATGEVPQHLHGFPGKGSSRTAVSAYISTNMTRQ